MSHDIDQALKSWEYKPGVVQARLIQTQDGRQVIQMRVDLGILQIETKDRPDGTLPHGFPTYFAYLRHEADAAARAEKPFVLDEKQCEEADREFVQYYHRRLCWLALHNFARAADDADHTLEFMDFVKEHSPGDEFTQAHEQYRGFVLFQRTQAKAMALEKHDPEAAVNEARAGLDRLRDFFTAYGLEDQFETNGMVQQLRKMERTLRQVHHIEATLQEQLERAVANEEYETAARIRDALKRNKA
jgi:hypothetical protein